MPKYRRWIFTIMEDLNAEEQSKIFRGFPHVIFDENGVPQIQLTDECKEYIDYAIMQIELTSAGQRHVQGYVEFKAGCGIVGRDLKANSTSPITRGFFGDALGKFRSEPARGEREDQEYCNKEETRLPGTIPFRWEQANATREVQESSNLLPPGFVRQAKADAAQMTEWVLTKIQEYEPLNLVDMLHHSAFSAQMPPNCTQGKMASHILQRLATYEKYWKYKSNKSARGKRAEKRAVRVEVIYGPPGTGKSEYVYQNYEGVYSKPMEMDYWEDYDGQLILLLDDFNSEMKVATLLRILDGNPMILNVKNKSARACWIHVFITTNVNFEAWYDGWKHVDPKHKAAVRSRISQFIFMDGVDHRQTIVNAGAPKSKLAGVERKALGYEDIVNSNMVVQQIVEAGGEETGESRLERWIDEVTTDGAETVVSDAYQQSRLSNDSQRAIGLYGLMGQELEDESEVSDDEQEHFRQRRRSRFVDDEAE